MPLATGQDRRDKSCGCGQCFGVRPVHVPRIRKLRISESQISWKFPMDLGIPSLKIKNLTESSPLNFRFLVRGVFSLQGTRYFRSFLFQQLIICLYPWSETALKLRGAIICLLDSIACIVAENQTGRTRFAFTICCRLRMCARLHPQMQVLQIIHAAGQPTWHLPNGAKHLLEIYMSIYILLRIGFKSGICLPRRVNGTLGTSRYESYIDIDIHL